MTKSSRDGLVVEGAQDVASPSVAEDIIESAIQTRDKPVVRPATVTVPEGTEIDPDNGDATPPIVLTPFPLVPPDAMELTDDVVEALKSHFPFSIPWDLYNLASAINAEPVAPTFRVSTPRNSSDGGGKGKLENEGGKFKGKGL